MSDAEIVKWLSQQKGRTCGRFRPDQLGKELVASGNRKRWTWRAMVLGLSAWLSTKTVEAHTPSFAFPSSIRDVTPQEDIYQKTFAADSLVVLKGRVLDAKDHTPIPGTMVHLKGTSEAAPTDANGYFSLGLPPAIEPKEQTVIFSFIGYKTQERKVSELLKRDILIISMATDDHWIGEVAVADYGKWYSPRRLYFRVRNLFR